MDLGGNGLSINQHYNATLFLPPEHFQMFPLQAKKLPAACPANSGLPRHSARHHPVQLQAPAERPSAPRLRAHRLDFLPAATCPRRDPSPSGRGFIRGSEDRSRTHPAGGHHLQTPSATSGGFPATATRLPCAGHRTSPAGPTRSG